MLRTARTATEVWKRKGLLWPVSLINSLLLNHMNRQPRGLIVEPSRGCTGRCAGCSVPESAAELDPLLFRQILEGLKVKPVTIHFAGKHSDPLAAENLPELVAIARRYSQMVSVSTIGLGLKEGWEELPVDRWILSIPAATQESWFALRGNRRLDEFMNGLERLVKSKKTMVELVLTVWKPSSADTQPFLQLAGGAGVVNVKKVFGRYDPQGYHLGRIENLALDEPGCPYTFNGELKLKNEPSGCPLVQTHFLDSSGKLHPCPFTGETGIATSEIKSMKNRRAFEACRFCP